MGFDFHDCLDFVLDQETAGKTRIVSDDPVDRGGLTVWGISQKMNPDWGGWDYYETIASRDLTELRSDRMLSMVEDFYRVRFWNRSHCDELFPSLRLIQFDAAVQHGPGPAIKFFQRACRIASDGIWGRVTSHNANMHGSEIATRMLAFRARYYCRILITSPSQWRFATGWFKRLFAVARYPNA